MRDLLKKFLIENYRHDRLYGCGEEYGDAVIDSRIIDMEQYGIDCISKFESRTGDTIFYICEENQFKILTDDRQIMRLLGSADRPQTSDVGIRSPNAQWALPL